MTARTTVAGAATLVIALLWASSGQAAQDPGTAGAAAPEAAVPAPAAPDPAKPDAAKPESMKPDAARTEIPRPDASKAEPLLADLAREGWSGLADLGVPIKLSGYFWNDTGYMVRTNAQTGQYDQNAAYMQGRFVLAAAYGRSFGDFAAMARVEFLGLVNEFTNAAYEPHTLDAYVKLGQKSWDFQIGRFLAWEVYYRGQGIELYTAEEAGALGAPVLYLLDYTRGLLNEPGQAAFHLFPTNWLALELAGVYGQQSGQDNFFGARPVADIKLYGLELIGGAEILKQVPQTSANKLEVTSKGYAARLQYSRPMITFGVDLSRTTIDYTGADGLLDTSKSLDKTSVGGFADIDFWRNSIGLGFHYTTQLDRRGENDTQIQAFISYLYRLPIEGLSVKAVYGFARAHIEDVDANSQWENYLNSVRIRILYDFH
jgi:hypothetical protein